MLSPSTVESSDGSVPLLRAPSCERTLEMPMSTLIAMPVCSMCVLWKEMSARQDTAARGQRGGQCAHRRHSRWASHS